MPMDGTVTIKARMEIVKESAEKAAEEAKTIIQKGLSGVTLDPTSLNASLTQIGRVLKEDTSKLDPKAKAEADNYKMIGDALNKMSETFKGILTKSFDVLDTIYKELKKSSPLLQAVEQLFNLAWTLFFMPLGNKLGELLIPAVIQLVDDVVAIWDSFEGKTLGEMFEVAIEKGIGIVVRFMDNISKALKDQGGVVGAIGTALYSLSNLISRLGVPTLQALANLMTFVIENLQHIISAIVAFKTASLMAHALTRLTIAASGTVLGKLGLGFVAAAGATAFGASELAMSNIGNSGNVGMASGGYVPATIGGQVHVLGEGGEGEYVIPESKMGHMGGNTYIINNYMMSTDEMDRHIREVIRNEVSASQLRSGF